MKLSRLLLVYFPLLAGLLFVAMYFAYHPGGVTLNWLGYRVDMHIGAALFLVAVAFLVLQCVGWLLSAIARSPQSFSIARSNARKAKGYRALTRGLTAVAAGDAGEARRHAKIAHDLLGEPPLTLLLAAQAAQLTGDEASAERYFDRLTQSPETALLGLRGLTMGAIKRGDEAAALTYAEKASAVAPQAAWAAETAHNLQVKSGKIEAAVHSLNQLSRAGGMAPKAAQRRRAALLTEQARRILASEGGDANRAMALGREAVKLMRDAPGEFVPARLILCRALLRQGKAKEAAKLIEQVWDDAPHAALGRAYLEAVGGDTPLERAQRVQKLVKQNPNHAESHRIGADAALTARLWGEARKHLEPLVELEQAGDDGLSADTCRRMARLEAGEHGAGSGGERQWLDMAAEARGGADWVCESCGTLGAGGPEAAGWQLCCPHCDSIDSLVWRAAGGASRQGAALGSLVLDQLPAAEAPAPVAAPAPSVPHPTPGTAAGPIPHGSLATTEPAPAAAGEAKPGKSVPLGASVDAARLVN